MADERLIPEGQVHERLGLKIPARPLVEHRVAVNIRKIRHVHPETLAETVYLNADDVVSLLQREYEVTERREVGQLLKIFRQMAGRV